MKPPCYNCQDRHELCHSECNKYKEYIQTRKTISENRQNQNELERYYISSVNRTIKNAVNRR